jgi:hypothetical protein
VILQVVKSHELSCRLGLLCLVVFVTSCAGTSRLHRQHVPEGFLRLAEVVTLAQRNEIQENEFLYQSILQADIPDSEITDGSVGMGRVFCCGGRNEYETAIWFYIPQNIEAEIDDIVEIWSGREVKQGDSDPGYPNTVLRIVEKPSYGKRMCRWLPEDPGLWVRVLYCDGLEDEGWNKQSGLFPVWVKPTDSAVSPP